MSDKKNDNAYSPENEIATHALFVVIVCVDIQLIDDVSIFFIGLRNQTYHIDDVHKKQQEDIQSRTELQVGAMGTVDKFR